MARGTAQKEYRAACARVGLEIPKEEKALWDAYAAELGLPTGRMIRQAVARDMAAAGWSKPGDAIETKAAEPAPVPAPKPAAPAAPKRKTSWGVITCMEED